MRVAALYDIHGNLPALEAVLADVEREGVDAIVIGGDIAGGPPQPREVIELVRSLPHAHCIRGNADRVRDPEHAGEEGLEWLLTQLGDEHVEWLVRLPFSVVLDETLYVAKDDVGKVIGRQGRLARALRTVVRASAARRSGRTLLEIVE